MFKCVFDTMPKVNATSYLAGGGGLRRKRTPLVVRTDGYARQLIILISFRRILYTDTNIIKYSNVWIFSHRHKHLKVYD